MVILRIFVAITITMWRVEEIPVMSAYAAIVVIIIIHVGIFVWQLQRVLQRSRQRALAPHQTANNTTHLRHHSTNTISTFSDNIYFY